MSRIETSLILFNEEKNIHTYMLRCRAKLESTLSKLNKLRKGPL